MSPKEPIVAVGLLTRADIALLGSSFDRLWPVEETPCFGGLLAAIDEADRELWRREDERRASRDSLSDLSDTDKVQRSLPAIPFARPD